jgi:SAM-dependent methyltransferase
MLPLAAQLAQRRLVCPRTREQLARRGDELVTPSGATYPLVDGVPILFAEPERQAAYLSEREGGMAAEYAGRREGRLLRTARAIAHRATAGPDHRSPASEAAFRAVVAEQPEGALCLSVGGGPTRVHPNLVNLNLDRFANVDVVADAYRLPYADGSVDAVHCEAVLEHLEHPRRAVAEMHRVLAPGGEAFAATPFLQPFHAYPNHFQNFTREGHVRLFRHAGFEVLDAGAAVGPTFALADLTVFWLRTYVRPHWLAREAAFAVAVAARPLRRLDRRLLRREEAELMASTTFVRVRKG